MSKLHSSEIWKQQQDIYDSTRGIQKVLSKQEHIATYHETNLWTQASRIRYYRKTKRSKQTNGFEQSDADHCQSFKLGNYYISNLVRWQFGYCTTFNCGSQKRHDQMSSWMWTYWDLKWIHWIQDQTKSRHKVHQDCATPFFTKTRG